jgi:DNA-3-methyladenine glycosylase I
MRAASLEMHARVYAPTTFSLIWLYPAMTPNHTHSDFTDGRTRCRWPGHDPLHHDDEWGVPVHNGRALWEHLVLDEFEAGLSWLTVLRKRGNFRKPFFAGFDPVRVAGFAERDIGRLVHDPGIILSKVEINAAISNARA